MARHAGPFHQQRIGSAPVRALEWLSRGDRTATIFVAILNRAHASVVRFNPEVLIQRFPAIVASAVFFYHYALAFVIAEMRA